MKVNFLILTGTLLLISQAALAGELTLNDYLNQVRDKHEQYKSAQNSAQAAELTVHEAHLLLAPNFFADVSYQNDQKPGTFFSYDQQTTYAYEAGFSEQTSFGLSGKLYYTLTNLQFTNLGAMPGVPPSSPDFVQGSPVVEFTFPFWRNLLGAETRLQVEAGDASQAAKLHGNRFAMKSLMVQAETTYWQLALARESVKVSQDALDRAEKLFQWHQRRAALGLADRADLLQAQAAWEARKIDLKTSQDSAQSIARNFNSARGMDSVDVPQQLLPLSPDRVHHFQIPVRTGDRDDVKQAMEQNRAAKATDELTRQKYMPTLELFGSYALNNPDPHSESAIADSFQTSRPTKSIGVRFSAPLDFSLIHQVRQGYAQESLASEYAYRRKLFDQETAWHDLTEKFQQAKDRLNLYEQLEQAQRVKLDYERDRRMKGRTTTQQVINFETDYEQAQLGRIRTLSEMLELLAQMKMYDGVSYESR